MELLEELLSQPTAPFREGAPRGLLIQTFQAAGVPHFLDPHGNLLIGASSAIEWKRQFSKASQPRLPIFMAHLDHPGFHVIAQKGPRLLEIQWHGGSPTRHLEGARVWLAARGRALGSLQGGCGSLTRVELLPSGRAIHKAWVELDGTFELPDLQSLFGGFAFRAPIWREGALIYTKAADDLIGCYALTRLALDLQKSRRNSKKKVVPFLGILTRAEEVGFIGALAHLNLNWIKKAKRPFVFVSLETSRTLPGAEIGRGPIVRLGDRFTVFDPALTQALHQVAEKVLPGKYQRRIMDGGSCEASATTAFGYPSIGISIPLGNYHNQSLEGGPDAGPPDGPAPEFVHRDDLQGMIQLLHGLIENEKAWKTPWNAKKSQFTSEIKRYQNLLRTPAG